MSRFWLTYSEPSGRPLGVLVVDSANLLQARFRAAVEGTDGGAQFCDGHQLDQDSTALMPPKAVGHMLSLEEAGGIIRRFQRVKNGRRRPATLKAGTGIDLAQKTPG